MRDVRFSASGSGPHGVNPGALDHATTTSLIWMTGEKFVLTVRRDLGDEVEFEVPASSRPLRGGGSLRLAAGNTTMVHKADLALQDL